MIVDYHIHTTRCGHADGEMVDYVEQARMLSLDEIGFSDHLPLLIRYDPTLTMSLDELGPYIQDIEALKTKFPDIPIKVGIEADYLPGLEDETAQLINLYDFDYVIGSIHFIDGWGFDDSRNIEGYKGRDMYELYAQYFKLVAEAAESGLFDIIGHLDLIKKYNFKPDRDITQLVKDCLSAIKRGGSTVEINTAGIRKPVGEMYPGAALLRLCFEAGVPITLGSDAHSPEQVGMDFKQAIEAAKSVGYDKIAVFNKRKRSFATLGDE